MQNFFQTAQKILYAAISVAIIIATVFVIFDALESFLAVFHHPEVTISSTVLNAVDRLLLALMFLEIMHTIPFIIGEEFNFACIEHFLLVGIIATIRRILIISLELSHQVPVEAEQFRALMIETGVHGALAFVLILGVIMLRRSRRTRSSYVSKKKQG